MFENILSSALGYLLGSIHLAYFATKKLTKRDLSMEGTRNIGATNAFLVGGKFVGILALVFDIGKGMLAVYLTKTFFPGNEAAVAFAAWFAVLGHDFSYWLKWKGGKGVATTGGALFVIDPLLTIIILCFWVLSVLAIRYFIPATVLILTMLPLFLWLAGYSSTLITCGLGLAILAVIKHFPDLLRYFAGKDTPAKFFGK